MTDCTATLTINPSGDWAAKTIATDENGTALDLTGFTASIVDVTGELAGALAASIPVPATGEVRLALTWQGAWSLLPRRLGTARLMLVNGTEEHASYPFIIEVAGIGIQLVPARPGDYDLQFTWPDDREGASLAGETLDVINASGTLAPLVSVSVVDAGTRLCSLHIEGDLATPVGPAGSFQLRRSISGAQPRTTRPFAVSFK